MHIGLCSSSLQSTSMTQCVTDMQVTQTPREVGGQQKLNGYFGESCVSSYLYIRVLTQCLSVKNCDYDRCMCN